jgi:hypothetical protein
VCCIPFLVSSKDNPAQAQARQALRAQEAAAAPKPAPAKPADSVRPTDSAPPADVAKSQPPPAKPAPTTNGSKPGYLAGPPAPDNEAQAKARAALREQTTIVATTDAGYSQTQQPQPGMTVTPQADTEMQAKAREAVRAETPVVAAVTAPEETAPPPQEVAAAKPAEKPAEKPAAKKVVARQAAPNPLTEGMTPPESPFTPEQQAALAELLGPYLGDQISTEEYHQKRAAIIAGS